MLQCTAAAAAALDYPIRACRVEFVGVRAERTGLLTSPAVNEVYMVEAGDGVVLEHGHNVGVCGTESALNDAHQLTPQLG